MLAYMEHDPWKLGFGDSTVLGWVTTVAYFIATGLCLAYVLRAKRLSPTVQYNSRRAFWWGLTVFMLFMSLNKQLDLQTLVLQVGRRIAWEQGWYAERVVVRKWIIVGFSFTSLILMIWLGWMCWRVWRQYILAFVGIVLLVLFVLIRASGHTVVIWGYHPGIFSMYRIIEVGGIVCCGASALIELCRLKKESIPQSSDF